MRKLTRTIFCAAIAALFAAFSVPANSATVITAQDGKWDSAETWGGRELPKAGDNVIIANKVTLAQSAEAKFGHVCLLAKGLLTVSDGATLKAIDITNFGEIINNGVIEIGFCDGATSNVDVQMFRETVAAGEWSNPDVWKGGTLPAKGEIVVVSHDVRIARPVVEIPLLLIVRDGATLSVGKDASVVSKQILNYGKIENEGVIQVEE